MAGNFMIWRMKSEYIDDFLTACPIGTISKGVAHEDIGWNEGSVNQFKALFKNEAPYNTPDASREALPPHKYFELSSIANDVQNAEKKIRDFAATAEGKWLESLDRRDGVLKSLSRDAEACWKAGKKLDALITELKLGNVSIEYYECDGKKVTGKVADNPYL